MINTIAKVALNMLRALVFGVLLLANNFLGKILAFVAGISCLVFVLALFLAPGNTTMLIAFFTLALVCVGIKFLISWAIVVLAPDGFMMPMD